MTNKKIASEIAIGIVLLLVIAIGGIFWMQNKKAVISNQPLVINNNVVQKPNENASVMCTQEAKQCADGSYVSRTGPKCEFAQCPVSAEIANWQTYKNEKYGFEFQYPTDFNVKLEDYTDPAILQKKGDKSMYVDLASAKNDDVLMDLRLDKFKSADGPPFNNPDMKIMSGYWLTLRISKTSETDIDKFIVSWKKKFDNKGGGIVDPESLLQISDNSMDNIPVKELIFDSSNSLSKSVMFIKGGYLYDMGMNTSDLKDDEIEKNKLIFNKSLTTFKFTK